MWWLMSKINFVFLFKIQFLLESFQETTNEVQPFTLDENFDYDNVVLSAKWDSNHKPPNLPP